MRPILELMEEHFCDRINKSKRPKEEVKHVELPAEENKKILKRGKAVLWIGDHEQKFVEVVTELDNINGSMNLFLNLKLFKS